MGFIITSNGRCGVHVSDNAPPGSTTTNRSSSIQHSPPIHGCAHDGGGEHTAEVTRCTRVAQTAKRIPWIWQQTAVCVRRGSFMRSYHVRITLRSG